MTCKLNVIKDHNNAYNIQKMLYYKMYYIKNMKNTKKIRL